MLYPPELRGQHAQPVIQRDEVDRKNARGEPGKQDIPNMPNFTRSDRPGKSPDKVPRCETPCKCVLNGS